MQVQFPPPTLHRAGACSYHASDVAQLAAWLEAHGWQRADTRAPSEYVRLWCGAQLLVIYHAGTCLAQGLLVDKTLALLAELAGGEP